MLESMVQANRPAGDTRTRGQRLGDAFVQWADNTLAAGQLPILRTVKPHVVVMIDVDDLADPHTGPGAATTGFGARISAGRARWLACDGNVTRIVIGPESQPLEMGRTHRVVPPHLRRAVENRDRHCVFAGCHAPSYWCDVHHVLHWIDGGETDLDNSALLCETPPHQGASRIPGGTTTRRPMAHLAARRHRDRSPPAPAHRLNAGAHGSPLSSHGRTVSSGHCSCHRAVLAS